MASFICNVLVFGFVGLVHGFLFDQMSDGSKCPSLSMLCPPMCRKLDSSGCFTCDCAHINPAMPMDPSNNLFNPGSSSSHTGSGNNPAVPLDGGNIPGSTGCSTSWLNCACAPSVDAVSGCLVCSCGPNNPQTSAATFPPQTKPTQGQQTSQVMSGSSFPLSSIPPANTSPQVSAVATIKTMTTSPRVTQISTSPPLQTTKITFNTKLPDIATTPSPSSASSLPSTTTTQAAFVCPGVFNCSLDCYAGFLMDINGCPQCQCAPLPTDLP